MANRASDIPTISIAVISIDPDTLTVTYAMAESRNGHSYPYTPLTPSDQATIRTMQPGRKYIVRQLRSSAGTHWDSASLYATNTRIIPANDVFTRKAAARKSIERAPQVDHSAFFGFNDTKPVDAPSMTWDREQANTIDFWTTKNPDITDAELLEKLQSAKEHWAFKEENHKTFLTTKR